MSGITYVQYVNMYIHFFFYIYKKKALFYFLFVYRYFLYSPLAFVLQ